MPAITIHRIPEISTAHITQEVSERLDRNDNLWCSHANYEGCGHFIYLDEPYDGVELVPQCLLDIRDWLKAHGFTDRWVRLDCDADTVPDLPVYDW